MVLEPELVHERIKFVSLFLRRSVVMIFTIIVSESHKDWSIWKVLGEKFLNSLVSFFQMLIASGNFLCWSFIVSRNFVSN
jgi:hypothetical protein